MFEPFTRSEASWGNLAHVDDKSFLPGLNAPGASKSLGNDAKLSSKIFVAYGTETITVSRTSKVEKLLARGSDDAYNKARDLKFEYEYDPLFDDVINLIKLSTGKEPDIRRTINTTRKIK